VRYSVQSCLQEGCEVLILRDEATDSEAAVAAGIGANLFRCRLQGEEWIEPAPNFKTLAQRSSEFGTPLLWPPGRVHRGVFHYDGREYRLPLNEGANHLHGELRRLPWNLVNQSASEGQGATVVLSIHTRRNAQIACYYPHEVELRVTYRLREGQLTGLLEAVNEGETPAPFGFGLHPYFTVRGEASRWRLRLPVLACYDLNEHGIAVERPRSHSLCARLQDGLWLSEWPQERAFYVFQCEPGIKRCLLERLGRSGEEAPVRRVMTLDDAFPYLAIFRPEWAQAVSVEPWSCITDAYQSPLPPAWTGASGLAPGECRTYRWHWQAESLSNEDQRSEQESSGRGSAWNKR